MQSPWRQRAAVALAVVAAVVACASVAVHYASNALLDSERFASRSAEALREPEMRAYLGAKITDAAIAEAPDLVAVRPLIESAASGIVGSTSFGAVYQAAVRDLHRAVIERDEDAVVLVLADIGILLRAAVAKLNPEAAPRIAANTDVQVIDDELSSRIADAVRTLNDAKSAAVVLLLLSLAMAGAAAWIATDRRRLALIAGAALAVSALIALLVLGAGRRTALGQIGDAGARDAARALWDSLFGDLRTVLLLIALAGAILAAAARSMLREVDLEGPLRRLWELVVTTPERTLARTARAIALLAAGIVTLVAPAFMLDLALLGSGLLLVAAGVNELIRLTSARQVPAAGSREDEAAPTGSRLRHVAVVGVVLAALVATAAVLTAREGGIAAAVPALDRCNGHRELCDRELNDVALAATHNSMSAATYPGWLFAQQERGIGSQLEDGVRALQIDTHYGRPAGGRVKTDVDLTSAARAKLEGEIGVEALAAAERIRDRLEGEAEGPRGIYLCHTLCELGALPIETAFSQIGDFLAASPHEVVMLIVQDDVDPEDFAAAVRAAGLERYAYEGPVEPPWPTLRTMIEADERLVFFMESRRGGAPWMYPAFESMQETPFTFRRTAQLTDPALLPASCVDNRGPKDASLFQVNHWIDTSPAPRPSNAQTVNAREPLLRRMRTCETQRGLLPNVVAVDFYLRGDLFGVVDDLNGVR